MPHTRKNNSVFATVTQSLEWPPSSPDPPDLFVWGYVKINVHASKPKTFDELKNNNVAQIDPDRCTRLKTYLNIHVKS